MRFTVVWKPAAEEELARIWTGSEDRAATAAAANKIDQLLGSDPGSQGESRRGDVRVVFVPPLGVFFHVEQQDCVVSVLRVWSIT